MNASGSSPLGQPPLPTSHEALEQLALAARPPITSRRDLRVHATVSVAMGLGFGGFTVLFEAAGREYPWIGMPLIFGAGALGAWRRRTRSAPRNAKVLDFVGFVITFPVMLVGGLLLMYNDPGHPPLWLQCLVAAIVALPFSVIARSHLRSGGP